MCVCVCGTCQLHCYIVQASTAWHRKTPTQHSLSMQTYTASDTNNSRPAPPHTPCHPGRCINWTNCIMRAGRRSASFWLSVRPQTRSKRRGVGWGFDPWPLPPLSWEFRTSSLTVRPSAHTPSAAPPPLSDRRLLESTQHQTRVTVTSSSGEC